MTTSFQITPLGDVLRFGNGKSIKPGGRGGYPVYGSNGVIGGSDEYRHENGIIIGRVGAYCGSVTYCPGRFWASDNTLVAFPSSDDHDTKFLYYLLADAKLSRHAGGAAQPLVTQSVLKQVEVRVPLLPIQRRIAGILSAYDDLIENSQRRIKILEEMARRLYREWFVHFRFPGHEDCRLVESPLGEIPEGWEVRNLFDLSRVNYGKNLPTKSLSADGAYPVYGAAKIIGRHTEYTREHRTIICGCRGSVGEMQITQSQCYVTNNSFMFDPSHADNFFWLFHTLKERGLRDVVGGAAQPQITLEGISSVELVTPPLDLRGRFQQFVSAFYQQGWVLDSQIQNLRRTRDLLLPRLLSGQIDVEALAQAPDASQDVSTI
jgi:type I restriction enzyme S subunit